MAEFEAVTKYLITVMAITNEVWTGSIANTTDGTYYWTGSCVSADVQEMFVSNIPTAFTGYELVIKDTATGKLDSAFTLFGNRDYLCEEY